MIFPTTTCTECGEVLERVWDGHGLDSTWLSVTGLRHGDTPDAPRIDGVLTTWDYLDWLKADGSLSAMREYSGFKVKAEMGALLPWQHWHKPDREGGRPIFGAWDSMPEDCCGMPMWLVRDGWVCRENSDPKHRARTMVKHPMHVDKDKSPLR